MRKAITEEQYYIICALLIFQDELYIQWLKGQSLEPDCSHHGSSSWSAAVILGELHNIARPYRLIEGTGIPTP